MTRSIERYTVRRDWWLERAAWSREVGNAFLEDFAARTAQIYDDAIVKLQKINESLPKGA